MKRLLMSFGCLLLGLPSLTQATSSLPPPTNIRVTANPELQNEEQVWMCDTDSAIIVANWRDFRLGYRQIGVGRSTDGGQTWSQGLIPFIQQYFGIIAWQSDPTLTGDQYGNFIQTALDFLPAGGDSSSTIAVYRSDDQGATWTGPFPAVIPQPGDIFEDKQFTTIDRTGGTYDGNFYIAWARFPNPNQIMFVRSTDGGITYDPPVVIGPNQTSTGCGANIIDAGQFANLMVHPSGDVHCFWIGFALDSGGTCSGTQALKHVVSTDGGQTFTYEDTILSVHGSGSIDGGISVYSMPACDADLTGGPFGGNMYFAFGNIGPEDAGSWDIDFMRSTDNGATWSSRITVNDDNLPLVDNFHPWLVVNEEGVIICIFYDQRLDPSHFLFNLYAAYSYDGGLTFTTNHRLSSASSSPNNLKFGYEIPNFPWWDRTEQPGETDLPVRVDPQAGLLGEYIGVTANYDKVNAVWTDSRDGNSEVYTANWYLPMLEPRLSAPENASFAQASPSFAWATSWKHNEDRYRLEISTDQTFATINETRVIDTNLYALDVALPDGIYFWRVKTFNVAETDSSAYSPVWQFEVDGQAPSPLSLVGPYNGMVIVQPFVGPFSWSTATKAASPVTYDIYLTPDNTQPSQFQQLASGLMTPSYSLPDSLEGPDEVPYYWYVRAVDLAGNEAVSDTFSFSTSCCHGRTGDVSMDGVENLTDLTMLINALFVTFVQVPCTAEANMNGDAACALTLTDLTALVNSLFVTFQPTAPCNAFDNTVCP